MDIWQIAGPTALAGAGLLVVAGAPKVRDPGDLRRALASIGLTVPTAAVRLLAIVEVVVGLVAIALPGPVGPTAVAVLYAGFTAFVLIALRRGGVVASCGCFGRADTPPTRSHAAVTALLALAAAAVALAAPTQPWWAADPSLVTAGAAGALLIGFLAWQVMAVLPTTTAASVRSVKRS